MSSFLKIILTISVVLSACFLLTSCSPQASDVKSPETSQVTQDTALPKDNAPAPNANLSIDVIKVPGGTNPADKRYDDLIEVLNMALEKTKEEYGDYQLIISTHAMSGTRFVEEVKSGENVNVIWRTYSPELSKELTPIYIDPRKGLLGYRLLLIRKEDQPKFSQIKTLEDLQSLTVGQGQDWMDVQVFEYNQMPVITGSEYEGLFKMLISKRFDYFSRGIGEIFIEFEDRKSSLPDMQIESELALYYPWPYFYYVNPNEKRISERIKKGLTLMLSDGSLDTLFNKYNQAIIEKANIKNRRIIRLENPLLKNAPFDMTDPKCWYNPEE